MPQSSSHLPFIPFSLLLTWAAGCASPGTPQRADLRLAPGPPTYTEPVPSLAVSSRGDSVGLYAEAFQLRNAIWPDEDEGESGKGIELEGEFENGDGMGLALGLTYGGEGGGEGGGLLYLTADHLDETTGERARFHGAFVEALARAERDFGWGRGSLGGGLGLGFGGLDYDQTQPDSGGAAVEGRVMLGLHLGALGLELGGGLYRWGHPGETIANGGFLNAGVVLQL